MVYGTRPLGVCMERGLFHRAVHAWLMDVKTGGLLMKHNLASSIKHAGIWGPTCHTEVECYEPAKKPGGHASELATHAASRALRSQLGLEIDPNRLEHWFSCTSRAGGCCELLDIYVVLLESPHLVLDLASGEEVEWVHFTDIFGAEAATNAAVFCAEDEYKDNMIRRIRARIMHADATG